MTPSLPAFSKVIEQAPDGVILVDDGGRIIFANARIGDLFGHRPADLIGRPVEVLMHERYHLQHVGHRGAYSQSPRVRPMGEPASLFPGRRMDGTEFPVEIQLAPIEVDAQPWTIGFIRDATERHTMLEELCRSRQVAQETTRVKGEFLSQAVHDLIQPIQTLELVISAIEKNTNLPSEVVDLAATGSASLARMRDLIKMLLNISLLESGAIQVSDQPIQVADICANLERQFGYIARSKSVQFRSMPCHRIIETDSALLQTLLSNLVANATRYTSHGEIVVECTTPTDGSLRLSVRDTGIGIPQEQLHKIFDDFYRGTEAQNASRDGVGLGLGIVRRLSKLLDFPVTVHSELGRGSTFAVQIPPHKVFRIPDAMTHT